MCVRCVVCHDKGRSFLPLCSRKRKTLQVSNLSEQAPKKKEKKEKKEQRGRLQVSSNLLCGCSCLSSLNMRERHRFFWWTLIDGSLNSRPFPPLQSVLLQDGRPKDKIPNPTADGLQSDMQLSAPNLDFLNMAYSLVNCSSLPLSLSFSLLYSYPRSTSPHPAVN